MFCILIKMQDFLVEYNSHIITKNYEKNRNQDI